MITSDIFFGEDIFSVQIDRDVPRQGMMLCDTKYNMT